MEGVLLYELGKFAIHDCFQIIGLDGDFEKNILILTEVVEL